MRRLMRRVGGRVTDSQGVIGVLTLAAGLYLVAGLGWSLVVLGAILLFGAWSSS